jgi:5'/3'-nucleotidase
VTCAGIVRKALLQHAADIVLVGVNSGPNIGPRAIHSGTIGGALTALASNVPCIAFSLDNVYATNASDSRAFCWKTAEHLAIETLTWYHAQGHPYVGLSINVPSLPLSQLAGAAVADNFNATVEQWSEHELLRRGFVTIAALQPMFASARQPDSGASAILVEWLNNAMISRLR